MTDESSDDLAAQLRRYADGAEGRVPPTPAATSRRSRPSSSVLAAAAALVVLAGVGGWWIGRGEQVDVSPGQQGGPPSSLATSMVPADVVPSSTSVLTTTTFGPAPEGLERAADDAHLVTFSSIGQWSVGEQAGGFVALDGARPGKGDCGTAELGGGVSALGSATGAGDRATIAFLWTDDASYRTASGVGVGTTYAALQRVYGEGLVFDSPDGWDRPTDGLLSTYQPMAGVRNGDRAIAFQMGSEGTVVQVKVSGLENWGDDEGCA
ncbi:MAG: hypothetical protein V9G12_14660 [Microthrixaceae bacterium]